MMLRVTMAVAVLVASPANAQTAASPKIVEQLASCRTIREDTARLNCFDRASEQLSAMVAAKDIMVLDREELKQTRRGLFGFNMPKLPFFKRDGGSEAPELTEVTAKVRSAANRGHGNYIIHLEDGAVWRTTEPVVRAPQAGGEVTIKKAALGSYMMRVGRARSVRVMRVN